MRSARAVHNWNALARRSFAHRIDELSFDELQGIGKGSLTFEGGVTVVCGANGVGKTTLLSALRASLARDAAALPDGIRRKLSGSIVVGSIVGAAGAFRRTFRAADKPGLDPVNIDMQVVHINPSEEVHKLLGSLKSPEYVDGLKQGVDPKELAPSELADLSRIVGRPYDRVRIYELDGSGDEPTPHFEVETSGLSYNTFSMGLGELAIHFVLWKLRRVPKDSIILIEEPESFLAPSSQSRLLDQLADLSLRGGMWIIVTTHSEGILRSVPHECVRLLVRAGGNVLITTPNSAADYLIQLGIPPRKLGVILVEDAVAADFTRCLIEHHRPTLLQEIRIVVAPDGSSEICKALTFPSVDGWFRIVGLLDGDESTKDHSHPSAWPHCYLPGETAPEIILRGVVDGKPGEVAKSLGVPDANLTRARGAAAGLDHHDWLKTLATNLGITTTTLVRGVFQVWTADVANDTLAETCFKRLDAALNVG